MDVNAAGHENKMGVMLFSMNAILGAMLPGTSPDGTSSATGILL